MEGKKESKTFPCPASACPVGESCWHFALAFSAVSFYLVCKFLLLLLPIRPSQPNWTRGGRDYIRACSSWLVGYFPLLLLPSDGCTCLFNLHEKVGPFHDGEIYVGRKQQQILRHLLSFMNESWSVSKREKNNKSGAPFLLPLRGKQRSEKFRAPSCEFIFLEISMKKLWNFLPLKSSRYLGFFLNFELITHT